MVSNCIIWGNDLDGITDAGVSGLSVRYCDVQEVYVGLGNMSVDPCFVIDGYWHDPCTPSDGSDDVWVEGDYHLRSEGRTRSSVLVGDLTGDGKVNLRDFDILSDVWLDVGGDLVGDLDGSGQVDLGDVMVLAEVFLADDPGSLWAAHTETSRCIDAGQPNRDSSSEDWALGLTEGENVRVNMGVYGGTSNASPAPVGWANVGDVDNDGQVDLLDFAEFAARYLSEESDSPVDLSRDDAMAIDDLLIIADNWLWRFSGD